MADINVYKGLLGTSDLKNIIEEFQKSLVDTNRSYLFFVNWDKTATNIHKITDELNLLDSLLGSNNLKSDFISLVVKHPKIINALPILLAIRERKVSVLDNFNEKSSDVVKYTFNRKEGDAVSDEEAEAYYDLLDKSGALKLFSTISNFKDYVMGVEVGMDTNARKNRSGIAMELLLKPLMEKVSEDLGLGLLVQKNFKTASNITGITFPEQLHNKKFDFLFYKQRVAVNVETNYFDGGGSKQEIINSYIHRQRLLNKDGGGFILITDGQAWNSRVTNELSSGFEALDYVINLSFVRKGFLKIILKNVFKRAQP